MSEIPIAPTTKPVVSRLLISVVVVTVLFIAGALLVIRFGGELSATLLGIVASVMAPTLGALFTMLVVNPLREIKEQANATTAKVDEVHELVDGQMTILHSELERINNANATLLAEVQALKNQRSQRAADNTAEEATRNPADLADAKATTKAHNDAADTAEKDAKVVSDESAERTRSAAHEAIEAQHRIDDAMDANDTPPDRHRG